MKPLQHLSSLALGAAFFLTAGCATLCHIEDPQTGEDIPHDFEGSTATLKERRSFTPPALLHKVEAVDCDGFDRVVFTFSEQLPGYRIGYANKPIRDCAVGRVVQVNGDAVLKIQFTPAQAHTEAGLQEWGGQATVFNLDRIYEWKNLRHLVSVCDFEGEVVWALGLRAMTPFRVVELSDPPRLVVDVKNN